MTGLPQTPDLLSYDHIIVYLSGGKDSLACLLDLLERGADPARIELWHHEIDGREGSHLMDWPVTPSYCSALAAHLELPIWFSWRQGGFEREMNRHDQRTAPIIFETPEGLRQAGGTMGKENTREQFPQVSADLKVRWCSASLKIDVASGALRNQDRFLGKRTLTISGERADESPARSHYSNFEPDRTDNRNGRERARHVDRWRPVHTWSEADVWSIIQRHNIRPHYAYYLGWGRVSCMKCIFGSPDQWASARQIDGAGIATIADYEGKFGKTIHRTQAVNERASQGTPYQMPAAIVALAMATTYTDSILMNPWIMPQGAFGDLSGPS
jgi:3'-phosphoadenosine 5'-phosphosulfate sulfotransferase (PAPS reductase)/FAD synthetase